MEISDLGLRHIAGFEGFVGKLYDDPAGHATIGYGFLVHPGPYHRSAGACSACDGWRDGMSEARGKELLREKVKAYGGSVLRYTTVTLTHHQFDALTSFCYNVGPGGYASSTVRAAVNAGKDPCEALRQYVRGVGIPKPLLGLVRRREAECALYHLPNVEEKEEDMAAIIRREGSTKTYWVRGGKPKHIPSKAVRMELAAAFGLSDKQAKGIIVSAKTFDFLNASGDQ